MKKIILVLAILFIASPLYADSVNIKVGAQEYLVEGLGISPRVEAGYEFNRNVKGVDIGLELGVGFNSVVAHDTQVETPYVGKGMGRLNMLDYYITLKWYLPYGLHIGGGIDYLDPYFREYYSAEADWDDEVGAHAQIGWEFVEDWTIINKWGWGDIDVESGKDPQWAYGYKFTNGILEAQSHQDYWSVMIERKF